MRDKNRINEVFGTLELVTFRLTMWVLLLLACYSLIQSSVPSVRGEGSVGTCGDQEHAGMCAVPQCPARRRDRLQ
jgi:hypothetical protein